jgi:hypothetical protein
MKQVAASLVIALFAAAPVAAQGMGQAAAGEKMTITGQVVDVSCYTLNGASGAGHRECAQVCADKGIALGILSNGTVYIPLGSGMANAMNPKLREHAERQVRVTGTHRFTNGVHTIEVESVTAAS